MESVNYIREIFAKSFLLTRKWEVIFNRMKPEDDLTLKQLMLIIVVNNAFEQAPTIKEVAAALSTSHQNVKAILKQLEKKNFVKLITDTQDKRITRVVTSSEKEGYWQERTPKDVEMMLALFENVPLESLMITAETIDTLNNIAEKKLNQT